MKTLKEKIAVNDEFVKSYSELLLQINEEKKSSNMDIKKKEAAVYKYLHICLPVMQMYAAEIEDTLNPICTETAFIIVAVLERMTETIKKRLDVSDEQVKSLLDMVNFDVEDISYPKELIRRAAE